MKFDGVNLMLRPNGLPPKDRTKAYKCFPGAGLDGLMDELYIVSGDGNKYLAGPFKIIDGNFAADGIRFEVLEQYYKNNQEIWTRQIIWAYRMRHDK